MRKLGLLSAAIAFLLALAWAAVVQPSWLPAQGYGLKCDHLILSAEGRPLGQLNHPQQRSGPWIKADQIPPVVRDAAIAAEDRRFFQHLGVDPLALIRAAGQALKAGRIVSGGSTLTMQLARLLDPAPRTWGAKLKEMIHALWLEINLSKAEILCQYLNRAPFGGPLVGLGAASRILFNKDPDRLAAHEAALLLALPQDPSRLLRAKYRPRLLARRNRILRAMAAQGTLSRPELFRSLSCPLQFSPVPEQALAPHFAYALKKRLPLKAASLVHTYINSHLQILLSRLVKQACASGQEQRIHQAAVLVLRNQDGAVLAWVGSTDFNNPASGQVDGVLALRQPGSTLKPFLYALALEQGRTLNDRLADEPLGLNVAGGIFRPVDYDHKHRGQVSLRVALASSLNLPALRLSQEIGPQVFLARLRQLGFGLPRSAGHYGLGLALGNGEVSLLELTTAYAALARKGVWLPARLWRGQKAAKSQRVLSRSACHLIGQALADDSARALGFGRHSLLELPFAAAVKTGTSQHHRDNWCVGYTRAYTVGVWVGNFEGRPMPGISGLTGAGPLWHQAMLLLNRNNPRPSRSQPAASSLPAVFKSDQAEADLERAGLGTAPVISAPQRLELITPCNGARFALDPDLPPGLQVLTCQARSNFAVSGADWRLNGQKLPPGNSPLSVRIRLRPGRHNLELNAWGRSGKALVRAGFTVSP